MTKTQQAVQDIYGSPFATGKHIYPPLFKDCGVNWYEPLHGSIFDHIRWLAGNAGLTMEDVREAASK